jgi:hypothetical protein
MLAFATAAGARIIHMPSYQELLDTSDLAVIAVPIATRETAERSELPGMTVTTADNKTIGIAAVGVETRFRVETVLKGKKGLREFVLHHYSAVDSGPIINGPMLAVFEPGKNAAFLLFLVREKDGRYAPTAGQGDPAYTSIHALGR